MLCSVIPNLGAKLPICCPPYKHGQVQANLTWQRSLKSLTQFTPWECLRFQRDCYTRPAESAPLTVACACLPGLSPAPAAARTGAHGASASFRGSGDALSRKRPPQWARSAPPPPTLGGLKRVSPAPCRAWMKGALSTGLSGWHCVPGGVGRDGGGAAGSLRGARDGSRRIRSARQGKLIREPCSDRERARQSLTQAAHPQPPGAAAPPEWRRARAGASAAPYQGPSPPPQQQQQPAGEGGRPHPECRSIAGSSRGRYPAPALPPPPPPRRRLAPGAGWRLRLRRAAGGGRR